MNSFALVDAWEEARGHSCVERPLVLLTAFEQGSQISDWSTIPVGERDSRLLRLRESLFGDRLAAVANCPQCGEILDIALSTSDIQVPFPSLAGNTIELASEGYSIVFRLPTTADLAVVTTSKTDDPRHLLLSQCILKADKSGEQVKLSSLPAGVLDDVIGRMGEADPQANVDLDMECPNCSRSWSLPFDICSYLWAEIEELVQRLFREIHTLALAYGWNEREILGMSPLRRRVYLDMVEE